MVALLPFWLLVRSPWLRLDVLRCASSLPSRCEPRRQGRRTLRAGKVDEGKRTEKKEKGERKKRSKDEGKGRKRGRGMDTGAKARGQKEGGTERRNANSS